MKKVDIYTDGACSGNPGAGGWCAILIYKGIEKTIAGGVKETTNNRMEMTAVIEGLRALRERCAVTVYSDSAYTVNAINEGWLAYWLTHNWRTRDKSDVKNVDLWQALDAEMKKHEVTFIKVKGHSDNAYNNRCDEVARGEIKKLTLKIGDGE